MAASWRWILVACLLATTALSASAKHHSEEEEYDYDGEGTAEAEIAEAGDQDTIDYDPTFDATDGVKPDIIEEEGVDEWDLQEYEEEEREEELDFGEEAKGQEYDDNENEEAYDEEDDGELEYDPTFDEAEKETNHYDYSSEDQAEDCLEQKDGSFKLSEALEGCDFEVSLPETIFTEDVDPVDGIYRMTGCRKGYPYYVREAENKQESPRMIFYTPKHHDWVLAGTDDKTVALDDDLRLAFSGEENDVAGIPADLWHIKTGKGIPDIEAYFQPMNVKCLRDEEETVVAAEVADGEEKAEKEEYEYEDVFEEALAEMDEELEEVNGYDHNEQEEGDTKKAAEEAVLDEYDYDVQQEQEDAVMDEAEYDLDEYDKEEEQDDLEEEMAAQAGEDEEADWMGAEKGMTEGFDLIKDDGDEQEEQYEYEEEAFEEKLEEEEEKWEEEEEKWEEENEEDGDDYENEMYEEYEEEQMWEEEENEEDGDDYASYDDYEDAKELYEYEEEVFEEEQEKWEEKSKVEKEKWERMQEQNGDDYDEEEYDEEEAFEEKWEEEDRAEEKKWEEAEEKREEAGYDYDEDYVAEEELKYGWEEHEVEEPEWAKTEESTLSTNNNSIGLTLLAVIVLSVGGFVVYRSCGGSSRGADLSKVKYSKFSSSKRTTFDVEAGEDKLR
mmetsp:Transcript_10378/g.29568  ORF Transcript_10378/g.29568 Transcript_10378/m.29568 type:complete len:668 (+) Transcript_10378:140-2143(+)